jgi:hypothetical protein
VTIACGRIGFDPIAGDGASMVGDGAAGDGSAGGFPAGGQDCASAPTIMPPVSGTGSVAGATNTVPVGNCTSGPGVIYLIHVPDTKIYMVKVTATFAGTFAINHNCPLTTASCGNFLANQQQSLGFGNAGDQYLGIDITGGTGTTFQLSVQ